MTSWVDIVADKGTVPTIIMVGTLLFLVLCIKLYIFKNQRYGGENPKKCPNCGSRCELRANKTTSDAQIIEIWKCTKCDSERHFVIK